MEIINFNKCRHLFQDNGFRFAGHRHSGFEANIIIEGAIELTCGKNVYTVNKNTFAIWGPNVFHMSRVISDNGCELLSLEFNLDSDGFALEESMIYPLNDSDISLARLIIDSKGEALKKLTEAFFIRISERDESAQASISTLSSVYKKAVNYMSENICADLKAESVARACGVCLTTLKKSFSQYAGKGVHAYFVDMKIQLAKEMIKNGKGIFEVSDLLGFSSPAYFSQCFKSNEGISPREYKKSTVSKMTKVLAL